MLANILMVEYKNIELDPGYFTRLKFKTNFIQIN